MKQITLILLATLAMATQVGCGGGNSSKSQAAATPTDTGATSPTTTACESWQVYTQVGCLNQDTRYCPAGTGYYPTDGKCYAGTIGTQIPAGYWAEGISIVNVSQFRKMLEDNQYCSKSWCPQESSMYFTLSTQQTNNYGSTGGGGQLPWYSGSSAAQYDYAAYFPQPQGQQAKINMITYSNGYWGGVINYEINSQARPVQNGFEVIYRGWGTKAYNKSTVVTFTYLTADQSQLQVNVTYEGVAIAQGTIYRR